jgi:hypothetical protein
VTQSRYGDIDNPPPFHDNWDGVNCTECCAWSAIDYFEPDNNFSAEDIDRLGNKIPGKWNWPQFMVKSLLDRGYDIVRISSGKTADIVQKGAKQYLIDLQGEEAAMISIENSPSLNDIEKVCAELLEKSSSKEITLVPTIEDIKNLLNDGFLIQSMVNARALNSNDGYAGHAVLIYGLDDEYIYFHDPDIPGIPNRKEKIDFFVQCAKNPKETNWYLIAYKRALRDLA